MADWNEQGEDATVVTDRTTNGGVQHLVFASGYDYWRFWYGVDWTEWATYAFTSDLDSKLSINSVQFTLDHRAESAGITSYSIRISS